MTGAVFLEGEQVELRTTEEEDLEDLRDIVNHYDVRRFLGYREPLNMEDEENWLENLEGIALTICVDGEAIGNIALEEKEPNVGEIGIMIDPEHHGNGYGTEATKLLMEHAFKQMNYHRVMARVVDINEKSRSLWEKLGYEKEGELREHAFVDGEFRDMEYYGLLRSEWKEQIE